MKAIHVKFLPCTSRSPQRMKADADGVKSMTMYCDSFRDDAKEAAIALCQRQGWAGPLIGGTLPDGSQVFLFGDSKEIKV